MTDQYKIKSVEPPDEIPWAIIGGGISKYNTEQAGDDSGQNLCLILQTADEEIVGGVIGATHWDWLYINLMWIKEEHRGRGYGSRLLTLAQDSRNQHLHRLSQILSPAMRKAARRRKRRYARGRGYSNCQCLSKYLPLLTRWRGCRMQIQR